MNGHSLVLWSLLGWMQIIVLMLRFCKYFVEILTAADGFCSGMALCKLDKHSYDKRLDCRADKIAMIVFRCSGQEVLPIGVVVGEDSWVVALGCLQTFRQVPQNFPASCVMRLEVVPVKWLRFSVCLAIFGSVTCLCSLQWAFKLCQTDICKPFKNSCFSRDRS